MNESDKSAGFSDPDFEAETAIARLIFSLESYAKMTHTSIERTTEKIVTDKVFYKRLERKVINKNIRNWK